MGYGSWSSTSYAARTVTRNTQTRDQIFDKQEVDKRYDPAHVDVRESRDSDESPESTALIFAVDVTGSMGFIAEHIVREGMGKLVTSMLETKPVPNPHIMTMAIGDITCDDAPLQVTQFEVDAMDEQLADLWLEGGGGGNMYESYDLPWLFAARKTSIDCFEKRGKKGYLFTIGDEEPPSAGSTNAIRKTVGIDIVQKSNSSDFLAEAREKYEVFHIIVEEGYHARNYGPRTEKAWKDLLGKRAVSLSDYRHISEVVTSVMRVNEGEHPDEVIESWQDKSVRATVKYALYG